jgi:hypothetical protein
MSPASRSLPLGVAAVVVVVVVSGSSKLEDKRLQF